MHYLTATVLALLAVSKLASAHGELPSDSWCADGRAVEVSSFRLEAAALERSTDDSCATNTIKTCGEFDDDYGRALRGAQLHCQQFAEATASREQPDLGSTSPLVSGPQRFLDSGHHSLYRLWMGVEGSCLRCDAAPQPVSPIRIGR